MSVDIKTRESNGVTIYTAYKTGTKKLARIGIFMRIGDEKVKRPKNEIEKALKARWKKLGHDNVKFLEQ